MDIAALKVFCDLVETGSFTRSAEAGGISQSAVSQRLARLEAALGTQLLSRSGAVIAPTEAGQSLYRGAKDIVRRYEQMLGEITTVRDSAVGILRVGTIYSVGFYLLDGYIRRFLTERPGVNLQVEYTDATRITEALLNAQMDLGVVAEPAKHRALEVVPLMSEPLVMVCSPDHRLALRRSIAPADLAGERFVAFAEGLPTRRLIDRILGRYQVKVNVVLEFDNIDTLKRAIEVNAGLSILPTASVQRERTDGHLCTVPVKAATQWVRQIDIVRRRGKAASRAEQDFMTMLRSGQ